MSVQTLNREYAAIIDRTAQRSRNAVHQSVLGHQASLQELAIVWEECRQPGWDGYDALAVEQETLRFTYGLIESLPLGFPRPSIGAEPDGQLTLEWRKSPSRI